jgi:hypothetical protein
MHENKGEGGARPFLCLCKQQSVPASLSVVKSHKVDIISSNTIETVLEHQWDEPS